MSDFSLLLRYLIEEYVGNIHTQNIERELRDRQIMHIHDFEDWALGKLRGDY